MSEVKERSGIFKFFYVLLSVITFPIFAVLFILRHPVWVIVVLMFIAGGMAYWPMSQGVKLAEVMTWYQNKYQSTKLDLAKKAMQEGNSSYVPQAVLDEMKKIEEEAEEAKLPKGENYNAKVVRDKKSEDMKATMRKRGGFKKKVEELPASDADALDGNKTDDAVKNSELNVLEPMAGGLSGFLPAKAENQEQSTSSGAEKEEVLQNATDDASDDVALDLGIDFEDESHANDVLEDKVQEIKKDTDDKGDMSPSDEAGELDLF